MTTVQRVIVFTKITEIQYRILRQNIMIWQPGYSSFQFYNELYWYVKYVLENRLHVFADVISLQVVDFLSGGTLSFLTTSITLIKTLA